METKVKRRLPWIDMARGYGILLVMLGHLNLSAVHGGIYIVSWIYTFHIPMFFFISGYLFSVSTGFRVFGAKVFRKLVIPYFSLAAGNLLVYVFFAVKRGRFTFEWLWRLTSAFLIQRRFLTVWFLACLVVVNLLMYALVKLLRNDILIVLGAFALGGSAFIYYHFGGKALPWNIDAAFAAMPFFCGGYLLKRCQHRLGFITKNRRLTAAAFVLLAVINAGAGALNFKLTHVQVDMFASRYGIKSLMWLAAFAGIGSILIFSKWFTLRPVEYIGKNTLIYFGWHQTIVMPIVSKLLRYAGFSVTAADPDRRIILYLIVKLALTLLILTASSIIINKTRLRYIFGKTD